LDFIKVQSFSASKDNFRQPTGRRKHFQVIYLKRLLLRIKKELHCPHLPFWFAFRFYQQLLNPSLTALLAIAMSLP
jgi:hypothetical protein